MSFIQKIFGNKNKRTIKKLQPDVDKIAGFEPEMQAKGDPELQAMTNVFRERLDNGASLDDIVHEAFAAVREASVRVLGMRHYDVQMVGGLILHKGTIAEMRTGEGKTLVATLPSYLNGLSGDGVHVITVNDYLASRDAEWMGRLHNWMGLEVGTIVHGLDDYERQRNYMCDITYGQNNEFGFDYLRDNMKQSPDRMVQRGLNYAIVDEVDSILIDEARTPLIISGSAEDSAELYTTVNKMIPRLKRDIDYTVDEKAHSAMLTDLGVERCEKLLAIDNLYDPKNIKLNHHVSQALRAHTLYKRDVNYLLHENKVVIVDEHTGRKMPGRRWSDGLHQAIEAKEGVDIEEENQTLATVTFQNYFRMYDKLSGMTGTADTEAAEFHQIYKLGCVVIPTNKPIARDDAPDLIYKNERGKFHAVIDDILEAHERGQPVLVGTVSVEKSEVLAVELRKQKIPFNVLNAKEHEREADIVAQAGRKGAITISTNMAGRGTDIVLGGNAETMAEHEVARRLRALRGEQVEEKKTTNKKKKGKKKKGKKADAASHPYRDDASTPEGEEGPAIDEEAMLADLLAEYEPMCTAEREDVLTAGGLRIVGTERHESRRIDNQLRGRAGRQGDPGSSRFYLSLEDDLLRIFGADRISGLMERMGMEEDVPIEHRWVTKAIENAQKKVEARNFDSRKNVLEYDDVMNQQRKTIYGLRRQVLEGKYHPTLSEEEIEAGKKPVAATESGDWTIESVSGEIKKELTEYVDFILKRVKERDEEAAKSDTGPDPDARPDWRILRAEIWRTNGLFIRDMEKLLRRMSREELHDYIVDEVARSLIQQRERMFDLCDTLVGTLVDTHCPHNTHIDAWDLDALQAALADMFNTDITFEHHGTTQSRIAEEVWPQVEARIDEREKQLGRAWLMYFSRHFYLEEIDGQWIDHLKSMDHLREGIYLRGYGQKDPKKEYKKEGFDMFEAMMARIQVNVGEKLFKVQMKREEEEDIPTLEAKQRETREEHPAADDSSAGTAAYGDAADGSRDTQGTKKQATVRRDRPKIGRNDPCHCGSGKKFKKCHGRDGDSASA
jgi:preprotein translocase subunit SecA